MLDVGKRIVVIGPSGSGKSSLARTLAAHLDVPMIELDALYHEPGWPTPLDEVFRTRVQSALLAPEAKHGYVVAGNYPLVQDLTWEGADTVIWLDLPLHVTLPRLVKRSWRRARSGEVLWGTNRERFRKHLKLWSPEQSLLAWNITRHRSRRRRYADAMQSPRWRTLRFIRVTGERGVDELISEIALAHPPS